MIKIRIYGIGEMIHYYLPNDSEHKVVVFGIKDTHFYTKTFSEFTFS